MEDDKYVIGVDYGTDSVRSILVNCSNGNEIGTAVFFYPRWGNGAYCDPSKNQFRQHPLDYLEGLGKTILEVIQKSGIASNKIIGIGIDTTGSTPVAVDRNGTPLSLLEDFADNPNAMFILWKDHTAVKEAVEINSLARNHGGIDYTQYEGGVYSSEWFWAKLTHIIRNDPSVYKAAYSWVEHCDWIPAVLTGNTDPLTIKRSRCAAGHKAMWHEEWGGLPDEEFLTKLEPKLKGLRENLYNDTYTSDTSAGKLSADWAKRLGLDTNIDVAVGTFDAHSGALGAEVKEFTLTKVMGTSTCDMLVAPMEEFGNKLVNGICGQVDGSIIPGMLGLEAGQSAFGDVYAWFRELLLWPVNQLLTEYKGCDDQTKKGIVKHLHESTIAKLSVEAEKIEIGESGIIALDWLNGRRTPYANQALKGAISGLNLGSDAPRIFRALVEATCFGSRKIIERFKEDGIIIKNVIALGGVAKKSKFVMQTMADVLNMPIKVANSEQTPALGAAMLAATASSIYKTSQDAQRAMGRGFVGEYIPREQNTKKYNELYKRYNQLGSFIENELKNNE